MKSNIKLLTRASLASLFVLTAIAAQKPLPAADPAVTQPPAIDPFATPAIDPFATDSLNLPDVNRSAQLNQRDAPAKASELIGRKIENANQQKIGSVQDLAVDLQSGRIVQVILSTGGFLSMGERYTAVPPGLIHFDAASKPLRFDVTSDQLKSAPALEMSQWTEFYQSDHAQASSRHYGQDIAFDTIPAPGDEPTSATSRNGLGYVQKATKLMGLPVKNLQDEKIGTVDNLIVDLPAGRVVAVIVSSGGFLGMGDTLSVVPPTALRFTPEHDVLRLDTTKEALTGAPRFKSGEWPDFAQRDYSAGVYRAYGVEPYFARDLNNNTAQDINNNTARDNSRTADADNTARNVRDRDQSTLTPLDQGTNSFDVEITRQIRQALTSAKGLSVNAQNVKIITLNGRVVLRGPVSTVEEKNRIGEFAARAARPEDVDNQLEVAMR